MLDIQHLTRRYQNKLAVSDLSLTFEKGKTYALLVRTEAARRR